MSNLVESKNEILGRDPISIETLQLLAKALGDLSFNSLNLEPSNDREVDPPILTDQEDPWSDKWDTVMFFGSIMEKTADLLEEFDQSEMVKLRNSTPDEIRETLHSKTDEGLLDYVQACMISSVMRKTVIALLRKFDKDFCASVNPELDEDGNIVEAGE